MPSCELAIRADNGQGNNSLTKFNSNNDRLLKDSDRTNLDSVRIHDYQNNFPKLSSNFDRPAPRTMNYKNDPPLITPSLRRITYLNLPLILLFKLTQIDLDIIRLRGV